MVLKNVDIRKAIEDAGLHYWEVASSYGLNDGNFSRLLRNDLTLTQRDKIILIIEELREAKNRAG